MPIAVIILIDKSKSERLFPVEANAFSTIGMVTSLVYLGVFKGCPKRPSAASATACVINGPTAAT